MFSRWKKSFAAIFLLNFVLAGLFYLPSIHSKFVYDINQHFISYEHYGWRGIWSCWGDTTIRWGINCVNYVIWRLFGASDIVWFTIFIACHALVAALLYRVLDYFLHRTSFSYSAASLIAMLLFLLCPYHSETIVWGATLFYITFTICFLGIILYFIRYAETGRPVYIIIIHLLFIFEQLTFEEFLIIPFALLIVYVLLRSTGAMGLSVWRFLATIIAPQAVLTAFYFLWNKYRIGQIVGHYGTATHFRFDIWDLTANLTKYLLKFSYVHLFFSYSIRDKVYTYLTHHHLLLAVLAIYVLAALGVCYMAMRRGRIWAVIAGFSALFFITLLPVLNLYFPYNKDIEQERYLYIPALFFYPVLVISLFWFFRRGAYPFMVILSCITLFFLHRNVYCWQQDGRINNSLIEDFRWPDAKRIFILLNGDDYCGAYMMRDMPESAFAEMLHVQRHIDIDSRSWDIFQYNVLSPSDSCTCQVLDSTSVRITFGQWGNWWWYKSFGAHSYDSTLYKADIDEWQHSFTVRFKDKRPGDIYIYQCRDKWVEIKDF